MVDYTDSDARKAASYAEALVQGGEFRHDDVERGMSILDVQRDALQFRSELRILERIGSEVPALTIDKEVLVPISLRMLGFQHIFPPGVSAVWQPRYLDMVPDYWIEYLYGLSRRGFSLFEDIKTI